MNEVAEKIAQCIRENGVIPFDRFMELALYCPVYGYYEREEDNIGRGGDYFTSVSVGSLFGELLAFQFADWLDQDPLAGGGRSDLTRIVEAGAHGGHLAADILLWLREKRPTLLNRLEYCIVEPSARRREWQQLRLKPFGSAVRWVNALSELARSAAPSPAAGGPGGMSGIIFANELLDAFPVRRFGWDAKAGAWFEWGVTLRGEEFQWTRMEAGEPAVQAALAGIRGRETALANLNAELFLPDRFTLEVCPAAEAWWREAAGVLADGRLLALDYGFAAEELLAPGRMRGTLRSYRQHRQSADVLASPGERDITAHVNFSALKAAGESAGLTTEAFLAQEEFLTRIAARAWREQSGFGEWTSRHTRQFQTLTHPEHLGRRFRVLVQATTIRDRTLPLA